MSPLTIPQGARHCIVSGKDFTGGALAPKSLYEEIVNKRQIREFKKAEVYPAIY